MWNKKSGVYSYVDQNGNFKWGFVAYDLDGEIFAQEEFFDHKCQAQARLDVVQKEAYDYSMNGRVYDATVL